VDEVGIHADDAIAFADHRIVTSRLREPRELGERRVPGGKARDGRANARIEPRLELPIERLRRKAQRVEDRLARRLAKRKGMHHRVELLDAPAALDEVADAPGLEVR